MLEAPEGRRLRQQTGGARKERLEELSLPVGASRRRDESWDFAVWAPKHKRIQLQLFGAPRSSAATASFSGGSQVAEPLGESSRSIEMERTELGYFRTTVAEIPVECRYLYRLPGNGSDGKKWIERPDPASRFQPEGVHGASQAIDLDDFEWTDTEWRAPSLVDTVFYELHVGTYTQAGTFDALREHVPRLRDLGITTIELMPVAQFPGARNWGYDGVYPYAVQNSYGGPRGLQKFVNAAHAHGLAVALDVVYNHLGPEGNYFSDFGPYFTKRYTTPWGEAINFDGAQSEGVRKFFIENAIQWFEKFHIDVLRLDAIHGIFDFSASPFLAELQEHVAEAGKRLGRELILVAESDLNDAKVLRRRDRSGYGIAAQWSDDFHHSVHTLLTKEKNGYYADFGKTEDLATVFKKRWLYSGQYSKCRKTRHGNSAEEFSRSRFVVCSQNHDQVGNRACGERLSQLVNFEAQKLAAGVTLLSPFVPLLFMGEEYGETAPFLYFTDHGDKDLIEAVRRGRREEFAAFGWHDAVPDPQDPGTFRKSTLQHHEDQEPHRTVRELYRELLRFRKENDLGGEANWQAISNERKRVLILLRTHNSRAIAMFFHFGEEALEDAEGLDSQSGADGWVKVLCSSDAKWRGPGRAAGDNGENERIRLLPQSFLVLQNEEIH
jgi:maltooligosyltrehalose trehalohydrolase